MRINRMKRINKTIAFYTNNFGFRKPFRILIDGTFCYTALKDQLNIEDQLKKYLGNDLKLLTTQCVVLETEKLGRSVYGAMLIVKQYPVHKCGHLEKPVTGSQCLKSMISTDNPNYYFVATQDRNLQEELRHTPRVPLLYFHNKAPTLEAPSMATQNAAKCSSINLGMTKFEAAMLSKLKKTEFGVSDTDEEHPKKKRRKGGPNPLSCKKKKRVITSEERTSELHTTKKRKRKKIPKHVKDLLKNNG